MKKLISIAFLMVSFVALLAQEDMPIVWESKMDHQILFTGTSLEGEVSYAASDKEMTVFRNDDGKTVWSKPYKEIAPKLRKIDELVPFWASSTIFLFDRKMGSDQIACINLDSGKNLWTTDKYQDVDESMVVYIEEEDCFAITLKKELVYINAQTGEELWSTQKFKGVVGKYVYDARDKTMVMVNFVPGTLGSLFTGFKNQIVKINMKNGEIIWENKYVGRADRKVITRDFVFDLSVVDDKVYLQLAGMQVYDLKTGAELWSAAFDYTPDKLVGKPQGAIKFGVYRAVADPVIVDNEIYILDMVDKKNQYVKKYDLATGKLIWSSKEIKDAKAIPGMKVENGKVLLQIGGAVEVQYHRQYRSGNATITETAIQFPNIKPTAIQAFNTSDGSLAWESEKFKKGITNAINFEGNAIVCSGKSLYSIDIATGNEKYEVPVSKGGVGLAQLILPFKDNEIVVVGEKGVSTFNVANGDLINSGKYKTSALEDRIDEILVMKTDKADIATFDLNTCKYKEFKARTGAITTLSRDGGYVYVYEKKTVTKLKTRD